MLISFLLGGLLMTMPNETVSWICFGIGFFCLMFYLSFKYSGGRKDIPQQIREYGAWCPDGYLTGKAGDHVRHEHRVPIVTEIFSNAIGKLTPGSKYEVYADGGCYRQGMKGAIGGIGIVIVEKNISDVDIIVFHEAFTDSPTSQSMHLFAIINALEFVKSVAIEDITLYTDDKQIVQCFTEKWYEKWIKNNFRGAGNKKIANRHLWETIFKQRKPENLNVRWAHPTQNKWMQKAGYIAEQAIREQRKLRGS